MPCAVYKLTFNFGYDLSSKDSFGRYLKSPVFKETQKKAVAPEPHRFKWDAPFFFVVIL